MFIVDCDLDLGQSGLPEGLSDLLLALGDLIGALVEGLFDLVGELTVNLEAFLMAQADGRETDEQGDDEDSDDQRDPEFRA